MRFITVRNMRNEPAKIRESLQEENEIILTSNGKPFAIAIATSDENLESSLAAIRRVRAELAVTEMQKTSLQKGKDKISLSEINAEIRAVRKHRK